MRYLDLLEAQLLQASRELTDASGAPAHRSPRTILRHHALPSALVAALALAVASAAITSSAGLLGLPLFWQHNPAAPSPHGMATSVPSELASSFSFFQRPRQPAIDSLPAAVVPYMAHNAGVSHYGVNASLSRFAGTANGDPVWLVPGLEGSCLYGSGNLGMACTANERVATQGITGALVPVDGSPVTIFGVLPDGASVTARNSDGTNAHVARSGSAYTVAGDPALATVAIHETSGHVYTLKAPGKAPFRQTP